MFDYHIHSSWSFDAKDSPSDICRAAIEAGLSEICFCEHIEPAHTYGIEWDGFIDFDAYAADLQDCRRNYPGLVIRSGLEIGLAQTTRPQIQQYLLGKSVDFIIASQHLVHGWDPYYPPYFEGKTKRESEELYLACLLECLKSFEPYSVVGHIGYVCKNSPHHAPMHYADYPDLIDQILKTAVQSGHGIEVNTSGYPVYNQPMPSPAVIKRFLELGGEILTIGSDAHTKEKAGSHFADALHLLRSLGARYICTFQDMKPIFHAI